MAQKKRDVIVEWSLITLTHIRPGLEAIFLEEKCFQKMAQLSQKCSYEAQFELKML